MAEPKKPQRRTRKQKAEREDAQQEQVPQEQAGQEEAPQADAPQTEAPQAEVPQAEAPQAEAPQAEVTEPDATAESPRPEVAEPAEASAGVQAGEADAQEAAEEPAESAPRVKPSVPGAHLEVDIVPEGADPLGRGVAEEEYEDRYAIEEEDVAPAEVEEREEEREEVLIQPIASAAIDLAAGARYRATGKRKTAIARVTLRPGSGTYLVNGRTLEAHFPRNTLQRNIRQPLETVGYHERMDVVARLHGGGISAQAGALRHGVSRALLEADPNLRGELKRRGFLTRDSRAKERKKAGLKKARKRPQFSKR